MHRADKQCQLAWTLNQWMVFMLVLFFSYFWASGKKLPARWSWKGIFQPLSEMKTWGQTTAHRSSWQEWTGAQLFWSSQWWCGCPWKEKTVLLKIQRDKEEKKNKQLHWLFYNQYSEQKIPSCLSVSPTAASVHRWGAEGITPGGEPRRGQVRQP